MAADCHAYRGTGKGRVAMRARARALAALTAALLLFSACGTASGSEASSSARRLKEVLSSQVTALAPEEALTALSSGLPLPEGAISDLLSLPEQAIPVEQLCLLIYLAEGAQQDSRSLMGSNLVSMLAERQQADGSFGFLPQTILAATTLENAGASYDRDAVIKLLIAAQLPDGSFGGQDTDHLSLTGSVLSLLSCFDGEFAAKTMIERAVAYVQTANPAAVQDEASAVLASLLVGLIDVKAPRESIDPLLQALLACQTKGGLFAERRGGEASVSASFKALAALDAVTRGSSQWQSLMQRGGLLSIELRQGDKQLHFGRRLRLLEGDTVLTATSRFCAANNISITHGMGEVLSIDGIAATRLTGWNPTVNGKEAKADQTVQPSDVVVWIYQ